MFTQKNIWKTTLYSRQSGRGNLNKQKFKYHILLSAYTADPLNSSPVYTNLIVDIYYNIAVEKCKPPDSDKYVETDKPQGLCAFVSSVPDP